MLRRYRAWFLAAAVLVAIVLLTALVHDFNLREEVAYVRMMGAQRGAMQGTVEDFADDIDEMCDQAGVPRRTGEPSTD